jgi:S1-C subfamily serine protease
MDAEEVFAEANEYTVRIDVTINTAFYEDDRGAGHGAGFLVDENRRWVMTNAHVAARSPSTIEVIAANDTRIGASKVYVDPYLDLAIIELDEGMPTLSEASLGCRQFPGTGHPVGAYGHPWGLNFTGTQGVISGSTERWGPTYLQTDTPINGGNSGGPLISMKTGRVIGINTSSIDSEDDQNTNFAVPIVQACRILSLLREGVDPSPPQLKIDFYDTVGENDKLLVARSFLSSNDIELLEGDEIVAVGEQTVTNVGELIHWLRGNLDDVHLKVLRENKIIEVSGQLTPAPDVIDRQGVQFSGVLFANSPVEYENAFGELTTIMVHDIETGSEGNGAGIEIYDFLVRVNGTPVHNLAQLRQLLMSVRDTSEKTQLDFLRISDVYGSGELFESVRRDLRWTAPIEIGPWPNIQSVSQTKDSRME